MNGVGRLSGVDVVVDVVVDDDAVVVVIGSLTGGLNRRSSQ